MLRATTPAAAPPAKQAAVPPPRPTAAQLSWQEAEIVVLLSAEARFTSKKYRHMEHVYLHLPEQDAQDIVKGFNPQKANADRWVEGAKALGAKAAVLVAKHELGFSLWNSDANSFSLKSTPWKEGKGDMVRDFSDACRKAGIKPGVFTEAAQDARLGYMKGKAMAKITPIITQEAFNRQMEEEAIELFTRYGDLFMVWYDTGVLTPKQGGPDIVPLAEKHQPNMIFYHCPARADIMWCGNESGRVQDPCWSTRRYISELRTNHTGKLWSPAMADTPIFRPNVWFLKPNNKKVPVKTLDELKKNYLETVGRNATLVLGMSLDEEFDLPQNQIDGAAVFGKWLKDTFGQAIAQTKGAGNELNLNLQDGKKPAYLVLQEDLTQGERVREYVVEYKSEDTWTECFKGQNIGHKRIIELKPENAVSHYRLRISKSTEAPQIKFFGAY